MPEWLLVILAIIGIILLGFVLAALDFFKGLARFLIFGLLVFLLFVLANRFRPASDPNQPYGRGFPPGREFETPRLDPDSDISEFFRNLGENIDEFIFGTSAPGSGSAGTTSRSRDFVYPIPGSEQNADTIAEQPAPRSIQPQASPAQPSRDLVISPSPEQSSNRSTGQAVDGQTVNQTPNQTTVRRPVLGLW